MKSKNEKIKDPFNEEFRMEEERITKFWVDGYKSIANRQEIEIRPLTILAGANSSGKSSIFQPLLLLKQTLENNFDAGALLLKGPLVTFTEFDQLVNRNRTDKKFTVGFCSKEKDIDITYAKDEDGNIGISALNVKIKRIFGNEFPTKEYTLRLNMNNEEIMNDVYSVRTMDQLLRQIEHTKSLEWTVFRKKCFLEVGARINGSTPNSSLGMAETEGIGRQLQQIIYLPGLRSNPERVYPISSSIKDTNIFEGSFERYIASIIAYWSRTEDKKIDMLNKYLKLMGLTNKVGIKDLNDAEIEIIVKRCSNKDESDCVNIADVGLGVSQILPLLVALIVARKGQIVYIEQPEIHLHPKAHIALAQIIADSIERGICIVLETHSELLLKQIQTLIAKKDIVPENVKLHWFERSMDGSTIVTSANVDKNGAFGEWPEDFAAITLKANNDYLDAVENNMFEE